MRDPRRIDQLLDALKRYWELAPEQRLGQLLINITSNVDRDLAHINDDELLDCLEDAILGA